MEEYFAEIKKVYLYGSTRPSYLLTLDYSVGAGSYNGPITWLVEVVEGAIKRVEAVDKTTGEKKEIAMMRSGKAGWKLVKATNGKSIDILKVSTRPAESESYNKEGSLNFVVTYQRIHFNGLVWEKYTNQQKGFWESDDFFPKQSLFP